MGTTGASTMITGFHNPTFSYTETPLNLGEVSGAIVTNVPFPGTAATFDIATSVRSDILDAYRFLAELPAGTDPGAGQLGGLTLAPGVYTSAAGPFLITGSDLTLDAAGDSNAVWVFQMASALSVGAPAAPRSVILINGAQAKNVYWQVGSAATINGAGGGTMVGTIITYAGATFSTAGNTTVTKLDGRVLSLVAAITMVNTEINSTDTVMPDTTPIVEVPHVTVTGSTAIDVVTAVVGPGYITVRNNGGLVTANLTTTNGDGRINIVNNGAAVTATVTGEGTMNIDNTGTGALTATSTGDGLVTINNSATAAVTVTNTGNGNITVYASGATAIALTFTDGVNHTCTNMVCD